MTKTTVVTLQGDGQQPWHNTTMDKIQQLAADNTADSADLNPENLISWGRDQVNKSLTRKSFAFFKFGRRGGNHQNGIGIPARATIISATLEVVVAAGVFSTFTPQWFIPQKDGKWNKYRNNTFTTAGGSEMPGGQSNVRDLPVNISGAGESVLIHDVPKTTGGSTFFLGQHIYSPSAVGSSFVVSVGGDTVLSSMQALVRSVQAADDDYDTWMEVYSLPNGDTKPGPGSAFLGKTDPIAYSALPAINNSFVTYNFTDTVTVNGGANNNYFWCIKSGKHESFPGSYAAGDTSAVLVMHRTAVDSSYFVSASGEQQNGFDDSNYVFKSQLPSLDHQTAFGSVLNIFVPSWNVVSGTETVEGLALLVQEWIDDEGYDPSEPIALSASRGDSADAQRHVYPCSASGSDVDPKFIIEYTTRRVTVV